MDPVGISTITSTLVTAIKIFEVSYQLKAVGEQTRDLLSTTTHVAANIAEAQRLLRLKTPLLTASESGWMEGVITDTEAVVRDVARLIEPGRVDMQTGRGIDLAHRVVWVFRDSPKVRDRYNRLSICHTSLNTVIAALYSRDVVVVAPVPVGETAKEREGGAPPSYEMSEFLSFRRNSRRRAQDGVRAGGGERKAQVQGVTSEVVRAPVEVAPACSASLSSAGDWYSTSLYEESGGLQVCEEPDGRRDALLGREGMMWTREEGLGPPMPRESEKTVSRARSNTNLGRGSWLLYHASRSDIGHGT